jgi:hypothetical protein
MATRMLLRKALGVLLVKAGRMILASIPPEKVMEKEKVTTPLQTHPAWEDRVIPQPSRRPLQLTPEQRAKLMSDLTEDRIPSLSRVKPSHNHPMSPNLAPKQLMAVLMMTAPTCPRCKMMLETMQSPSTPEQTTDKGE